MWVRLIHLRDNDGEKWGWVDYKQVFPIKYSSTCIYVSVFLCLAICLPTYLLTSLSIIYLPIIYLHVYISALT